MEFPNLVIKLQNPFSICVASFLFLFVLFKVVKGSSSQKSIAKLPPGPRQLPLIGNLHQLSGLPHHCFRNLAAKYGPLVHLKLGQVSTIVVSSPELAKLVLSTHDINFCDRPQTIFSLIVAYNGIELGYAPYGDYYRHLRKICNQELLSPTRVQTFRSIREEEVSQLIKSIYASEGSVVNLSEKLSSLTYGITARASFGKRIKGLLEFIPLMEESMVQSGGICFADLFPCIKLVLEMISTKKARLLKLHHESDRILQEILDEYKRSKSRGGETVENLVDLLIKLQQEDLQHPLTDVHAKAIIMDMLSGSGQTTSGVVEWAISEMIRNPKVMEKAQAEVRKVYGNKGSVDESELHQLIYLKAVIKETLRLRPPVPMLLPRLSREAITLNGYVIPAKTKVIVNAWAIGRDPKYWTEAESFKPERFLDNPIDYRGTHFEYIPFGSGRRNCPGLAYAFPNIELALAQLLYHFDWKLPNGMKHQELDMTETLGISLPATGRSGWKLLFRSAMMMMMVELIQDCKQLKCSKEN